MAKNQPTATELGLNVNDIVTRVGMEKKGEYTITALRRVYVSIRRNSDGKEMLVKASTVTKTAVPVAA